MNQFLLFVAALGKSVLDIGKDFSEEINVKNVSFVTIGDTTHFEVETKHAVTPRFHEEGFQVNFELHHAPDKMSREVS